MLGQDGVWTTTANSDIVVETGVHVRAKQSFIDLHPAKDWDYTWSFEPQTAGAEPFEVHGFSAANLYTVTGTYTVELTLTPTGDNSSSATPESLDVDVVNPTGGWTDVNVSSSSGLTTAINNLHSGNLENRRILLQRNTTYTLGGSFSSISDVRNIVIRAADGTGSLPEIKLPAANFSESDHLFDIQSDASTGSTDISRNITIRDIKVTTDSNSQTSKHDSPQFLRPTGSNIVVANIQYTNLDTFVRSEGSPNYLDGLLVLNNEQLAGSSTNDYAVFVQRASKNSSEQPLVPSGGVASVVSNVTIVGNTFRDSYYEHNIRTLADYVNASGNTLINSFNLNILAGSEPNKKSFNTLRANHGTNIWWDSNQVYSGQVQLILAPPSDGGFDKFDKIENVVIRRNHLHAESAQDGTAGMAMFGNPMLQVKAGPKHVVIDDNILEAPGRRALEIHSTGSITYSGTPNNGTVPLATEDISVRHNTVLDINPRNGQSGNATFSAYSTDPVQIADVKYSAGLFLRVLGTPSSPFISLQNNLFVAPYVTTSSATSGGVVIDSSAFSSVFSSIRGNIWPSVANMHRTGSGRVSNPTWLATYSGEPGFVTILKDDFENVLKWIPSDSVANELNVVTQASGLREDIYGTPRPARRPGRSRLCAKTALAAMRSG